MLGAASGAVAGLVAVTPAAGFAGPMGAIVLGIVVVGGLLLLRGGREEQVRAMTTASTCSASTASAASSARSAPASSSIPHSAAPASSTIRSANFAAGYAGTATQVWRSSRASLVTLVWSGIGSAILYKIVDLIVGLRSTSDAEREGLDLTSHGEAAYHPS